MSNPITITVTAETQAAAAALRAFCTDSGNGLKAMAAAGVATKASLMQMRESAMGLHEGFRTLEMGVYLLGGQRFPQLATAVMGVRSAIMVTRTAMKFFELSLSEVLLPLIAIGATIAGGLALWDAYNPKVVTAAEKAKKLSDALEKIPELLRQIAEAQKLGALTPDEAKKYQDYLSGKKKLYVAPDEPTYDADDKEKKNPHYNLTEQSYRVIHPTRGYYPGTTPNPGGGLQMPLPQASIPQVNDFLDQKVIADRAKNAGTVAANEVSEDQQKTADEQKKKNEEQQKADADKLKKQNDFLSLVEKTNIEAMSGLDKEVATIHKKYDDERQEILDKAKAAGKVEDDMQVQAALTKTHEAERLEIQQKTTEAADKELQKQKEKTDELLRQQALQHEIMRSAVENQIKDIQQDPTLINDDKVSKEIPFQQALLALDAQRAAQLTATIADSKTSDSARLEAQKELNQLTKDQGEVQRQITEEQNRGNFVYQFSSTIATLQNQWTTWAQESANAFKTAWDGATSAIGGGLTHLFEYGAQKGQWFREIWNGVIGSMISSFTDMVVSWMMHHVIMAGISSAFNGFLALLGIQRAAQHAATNAAIVTIEGTGASQRIIIRTGEAAHDTAMTATQVGTHATGEAVKTGTTGTHVTLRMFWRNLETMAHNIGVALRTMFHVGGETASTTATAAGATTRIGAHAAEAGAGAAASQSMIPFVGPILAVAAMVAIMAAIMALAGGFEAGGYTGGQRGQFAGIVHGEEFVFSAPAVDRIGVENLAALHDGRAMPGGSSNAATAGGGHTKVSNYIYHDRAKMARDIERDDAHEKWVADIAARTISKFA